MSRDIADLPPLPDPILETVGSTGLRPRGRWLWGGLLVVDLLLLLFALSFANITAEGAAERTLGHSVAVLAEIDAYVADHYESLQNDVAPGRILTLPDFPVEVSFTSEEMEELSEEEFRALALQRAADVLYDDGMAAFGNGDGDPSAWSLPGALHRGLDLLRPQPHTIFTYATIIFAVAGAFFAFMLARRTSGYGKVLAIGVSALLASLPFLVFAVAVRFALRVAADGVDEYLAHEFLVLGQEITWAPIRNGLIFSIGAGTIAVLGGALSVFADRR